MLMSTKKAAEIVGLSASHLRKLVLQGKIKGEKIGRNYVVNLKDLKNVKRKRKKFTTKKG